MRLGTVEPRGPAALRKDAGRASEDFAAEMREHFRDFGQEIVAVSAREAMDADAVPTLGRLRRGPGSVQAALSRQRFYLGGKIGIEEQREGEAIPAARVANAVGRRAVPAAGQTVEHVADIADESAR